jgi:hypothetical protein
MGVVEFVSRRVVCGGGAEKATTARNRGKGGGGAGGNLRQRKVRKRGASGRVGGWAATLQGSCGGAVLKAAA